MQKTMSVRGYGNSLSGYCPTRERRSNSSQVTSEFRDNSRRYTSFFHKLPAPVWISSAALIGVGGLTANPILTAFAVFSLPLLTSMLWVPGEPPALLFACLMQWLQASIAIFYSDWQNVPLEQMFRSPMFVSATWLSLIGVLVLALGIRIVLWRRNDVEEQRARLQAFQLRVPKTFIVYLVSYIVFSLLSELVEPLGGLRQAVVTLGNLRWVFVFLIMYGAMMQRRHYRFLAMVFGLELLTGVLGFFSEFKTIFFMLLIAVAMVGYSFTGWRVVQLAAVTVTLTTLSLLWFAIRVDYRNVLNEGSGKQEVRIPVATRIETLRDLSRGVERDSLENAFEKMILRVSYVEYFALSMDNVPARVPHENGGLWWDSVKQALMPRLLFPDKRIIDDSRRTTHYTGVRVAGLNEGTSIGIGYMGESYIDFGPIGMFAPILSLGVFYGFIYRLFAQGPLTLMGFAIATVILVFGAAKLETSNIGLVGGNLTAVFLFGLFAWLGAPTLWGWLAGGARVETPSPIRMHQIGIQR